jgi:hypothetical protein
MAGFGFMHIKLQLNDDGWIVLQVTIRSKPDEIGIHLSLQQAMQGDISNNVGDSCTTCNSKIQSTYVHRWTNAYIIPCTVKMSICHKSFFINAEKTEVNFKKNCRSRMHAQRMEY